MLLVDRLLVPIEPVGLQSIAVTVGPARVNWPQYRHDARRTARAQGWLEMADVSPTSVMAGEDLSVTATFGYPDRSMVRLELVAGSMVVAVATNGTGTVSWSGVAAGEQQLSLRGTDTAGDVHFSPTTTVRIHAPPRLRLAAAGAGEWAFEFQAIAGRTYRVQRSRDLRSWEAASDWMTAAESTLVWSDENPLSEAAYYRVGVLP